MDLVPADLADVKRFIALHHRHNPDVTGWRIGAGLAVNGDLVGVYVIGRPVSPKIQAAEPRTMEITRVCTLDVKNANSRLYGAACRAGAALGYTSAITYTLESESGASLKAAGFTCEGPAGGRPGQTWNVATRPRREFNLFGESVTPHDEPKLRWRRAL